MFGLNFQAKTLNEMVCIIGEEATHKNGRLLFTPNVDHVVRMEDDSSFRKIYLAADWIVADGMPLVWFSRLVGRPLPERVTGADLLPALCQEAAKKGLSVYFFGAAPGIAEEASQKLFQRNPGLKVAGFASPSYGFENNPHLTHQYIDSINQASPDILFVGLGSPKQEFWAYSHRQVLNVGVIAAIGGAFDFASGRIKRAPSWVQVSGIEWLWRLFQEPGRLWKRYLVRDSRFLMVALREWIHQHRMGDS